MIRVASILIILAWRSFYVKKLFKIYKVKLKFNHKRILELLYNLLYQLNK